MTAVLLSLALALLCLLQAGAEVPVQPGFNIEKFAGMWHVAAAVSNCSVFLKMKDGMKSSIATISFTPAGDLAMKLVWPLKGAEHEPPAPAEVQRAHPHRGPDQGHAGHPAQVGSVHLGHRLKGTTPGPSVLQTWWKQGSAPTSVVPLLVLPSQALLDPLPCTRIMPHPPK
ncbi:uncharacterized protein LOC128154431 isoform X2 [Harpia harpyja]|uniref:uncharacterized protein LOC128154431 isoform X2 n=1 Tax=Harpia harpyja TaxID=202280 RepID=UPI0022B0AC11|nr:uncharacterized protein LOC128154431 isoform X2 [Harpia harpyja]